jgi:Ser/Thr protein kinase RdoA (MazF antagonist)
VAKVYEGDEGRHSYAAMTALWGSPLRFSSTVRIAEPLAFLPELNVVLQELVPGNISLKDHLKQAFAAGVAPGVAALTELVRKSGRGLAELHTCGAAAGPDVTADDQIAALRTAVTQLDTALADSSAAIEPLIQGLERVAVEIPAAPLVPTHRSFRPAQILLDGEDIALLDFDGYCRAEPGLDLSLFRTTLVDLCLRALEADDEAPSAEVQRERQAQLDSLCASFLAGYEEVAAVDRERLALWDAMTSAKDIVDCWRKVKFEHLDRRMEFLRQRLRLEPDVELNSVAL